MRLLELIASFICPALAAAKKFHSLISEYLKVLFSKTSSSDAR